MNKIEENLGQMNIQELLKELRKSDIDISLDQDGNLAVHSNLPKLPEEYLAQLRANKKEILAYLSERAGKTLGTNKPIPNATSGEDYPLSESQNRLWILSQFEHGSVAYNMPSRMYLDQAIDIDRFKKAIEATIERHEMLRTVFIKTEDGEIRQRILDSSKLSFSIDYIDFRQEANKEDLVNAYMKQDSVKAFDLEQGPLLRAALLQLEDDGHVFYYNMHHIISDGWSMEVLSNDVIAHYQAYQEGKEPKLDPLRIQYKDYSVWQLSQLTGEGYLEHRNYWLSQLAGELPLLNLPSDSKRPEIKTYSGNILTTYIDKSITSGLRRYTQEHNGTLFMGLVASLNGSKAL